MLSLQSWWFGKIQVLGGIWCVFVSPGCLPCPDSCPDSSRLFSGKSETRLDDDSSRDPDESQLTRVGRNRGEPHHY
jgi:hypothetical protein